MTVEADSGDAGEKKTSIDVLYRKYSQALRIFLGRRRLSRDDAEDVVQETYCRVLKSADLDAIQNPKAFLFRIATNVHLNEQKHRRAGLESSVEDIEALEIAGDAPTPERHLRSVQELDIVSAALDELPQKCREAFVMNRFDNMNFSQIAIELNLSVSMIEKHVSRAISHMRQRLEESQQAPASSCNRLTVR